MTTTSKAATPAPEATNGIVPRRWRKLATIGLPLFADNNEISVLSTLAPVIIAALALPLQAVGILVSIAKGISIVAGPMWAWIARKTNRKMAFFIASLMTGLGTAATGLAQNYFQLIALWSLTAIFVAAALPIVTEITTDLFDEKSRGRASGYTWGAISLIGSVAGPLTGQLANVEDGWRYGFFIWGAFTVLASLVMLAFFKDPGLGASEPTTQAMTAEQRAENEMLTWAKVRQLTTIPTFVVMLFQRLLSGHLLIASFGIIYLVNEHGFTTAVAAVVTLPFGLAYVAGTFFGGIITDYLHTRFPSFGRVAVLQAAQFMFGIAALIGTQISWNGITIFAIFWALMGFAQGLNPGVNRPIVAAVVPPELRGAAFALLLSVFEAMGYMLFNLLAGFLGEAIGLSSVMFWIPGVLMLVNGAFVTILYRTYPRDVKKLGDLLLARTNSTRAVS